MPRKRSKPDAKGTDPWLSAHAVLEAAITWHEAIEDEDDRGLDVATTGLQKAVRAYLRVRARDNGVVGKPFEVQSNGRGVPGRGD